MNKNKSRILRFAAFVLCVEFAVVAALFASRTNPVPADDILPTQMVLPVAATPTPQPSIATNRGDQNIGVVAVEPTKQQSNVENNVTESNPVSPVDIEKPPQQPTKNSPQNISGDPLANLSVRPTHTPEIEQPLIVPNQVVLQFKPDAKPDDINTYVASVGGTVSQKIDALNTVIVNIPVGQSIPALPSAPVIVNSEPDYFVTAQMDVPPSDPLYAQQWSLPVIDAPNAWKTLPPDALKVTVAVIDSGICVDHPDLKGRTLAGWDFVENDAVPQDEYGHGCAIAGIIAANVDDGTGMAGVAPNAMIMPLRVLDAKGVGTYSNVAAAIVYAADHGAQVINLSVGGSNSSTTLENAINYAVAKNITVVAAAGNSGGNILYPAAYTPVISVGSVDSNLQRSSFSSYLPQLDTLAPGSNILTTALNQGYQPESGTSFAAAEVSGVVALNIAAGNSLVFDGSVLTFGQHEQIAAQPTPSGTFTPLQVDDGEVQPLAVIGPVDSRVRVANTTSTPNSAVVLILFKKGTTQYICSGSIIAPQYVLTAGHCAYDEGIYSSNIFIFPGNNGASEPYGYFTATLAYIPQQWIDTATGDFSNANVNYDWALLRLNTTVSPLIVPFAISSYSDTILNNTATYTDAGYPADKCRYDSGMVDYCPPYHGYSWDNVVGQGDTQWTASGPIVPAWLSTYLIGNQIDTFGGQSGSPLYVTDNNLPLTSRYTITGVLSHSLTPNGNSCYGVFGALCPSQSSGNYFRRVTEDMLEALVANNVPFTNPVCYAVNLMVSGSGIATRSLPRSTGCTTGTYTVGTIFSLSAVASPGNIFTGWQGATGDVNTTYQVTGPATITATFAPQLTPTANMILSRGIYDDQDGNIVYNGGWSTSNQVGPSGGTSSYTYNQNAIAQFAFNGTGFILYRSTASGHGSMEVCVDTSCQTVSNSSATFQWTVPFQIDNGSVATRIVRIRNLSWAYIDLDAVQILGPNPAILGTGTYQENDINLAYTGIWLSNNTPSALGGGRRYTNDATGTVNFTINNTVGRIVVYRSTYLTGVYGSLQVFVDSVLTTTINNTSSSFLFGVAFPITIPPGNHTITLKNVGSTYSDIDQITLLPAASPLAIGTYQETNTNLTYSGLWTPNSTGSALGGSRIYTNDSNSSVSFAIDNTVGKVTIYRTTYLAGVYGSMRVYLDGATTPFATLDNTSSAFLFQQPFTFAVIQGSHVITLKNVGSTYSDLDQIVLEASTPVSTGSYQETNAALIYNGTWTSNTTPSALGGSRKYTNDPNGTVSFVVDNSVSRITLYRTTYLAGVYGSMQVFLDNSATPFVTVNNTSAGFTFGVPYTFTVIPGSHVITLKNVGSTYSDLDQVSLLSAAAPLGVGTYQETDTNLTYSGLWTPNSTASALGGSRIYTNDPNGTVSFSINNTVGKVTIYRTTYTMYGSMQVYLDGAATPFTTLNNTSSAFLFQQPFTFAVIPGSHTITLKNVGSTYSDLDQIVLEAATTLATGTYQETDAALIYNGIWTSNTTPSALGGSRIYTNDPNGSVSFVIDNSVSRVTIYRTTYLAGVYGSMQVFLDNSTTPFATLNNTSTSFLFGQPYTFTVAPGNHIVTLKNVGSTYSDLDQIALLSAAAPLGVGTYQETDANLTYSGLWTPNSTASALGNSRIYTNDPNGTVSFAINNTVGKVTIYRTTYTMYGSMQVYLDGAASPFATLNNNSSAFLFQQPFTFAVIPGSHVITLKNVGSTYSDLDQIVLAASTPLATGTYQETDAALIYNGTWTSNATPSALGGSRIYSNDPTGSVSFVIDNSVSRVTIYRTTYLAGVYGSMQVFLDNNTTPLATVNNTSTSFLFGQPFTFTVTPGNHIVTVKNVGSTYSDLDQIVLLSAAAPLGVGTYQETDTNLTYSGLWTPNSTASALGGSRIYTNDPNGTVSFTLNNTVGKVTIYRTTYTMYGSMQVYLDGAASPFATLNNNSSAFLFQQPFTFAVVPASHTITLKNVGSTYSDLDQIVLAASTALPTGTYQETDAALIYNGTWTSNATPSALGGSRIYTNDPNGSVSFAIDNSVGNVTIYRTTYLAGVYGSMQVFLDNSTTPLTTLNNTNASFIFGVPFSFPVTPGNHVITLKNVGSTYSDIDQITLLAAGAQSQPLVPTATLTPTLVTVTPTSTVTATVTASQSATVTSSPTPTTTITVTPTLGPSSTLAPTIVPTSTITPVNTLTSTVVSTTPMVPTSTASITPVPTDVSTSTAVPTDAPSITPVPTDVPTSSPVPSATATVGEVPTSPAGSN